MSLPVIAELFHGLASTFRATDIELAHWSHLVGDAFLGDCPNITVEAARREGFMFGITNDGHVSGWRNQGRSYGQTIDGVPLVTGPSLFFGPTYDGLLPMRVGVRGGAQAGRRWREAESDSRETWHDPDLRVPHSQRSDAPIEKRPVTGVA